MSPHYPHRYHVTALPAQQITLVTDGVVEARAASGELFGFERTAAIAGDSADSISRTAREFGQDDDITVLTLTRLAAGKPSSAQQTVPVRISGTGPVLA